MSNFLGNLPAAIIMHRTLFVLKIDIKTALQKLSEIIDWLLDFLFLISTYANNLDQYQVSFSGSYKSSFVFSFAQVIATFSSWCKQSGSFIYVLIFEFENA